MARMPSSQTNVPHVTREIIQILLPLVWDATLQIIIKRPIHRMRLHSFRRIAFHVIQKMHGSLPRSIMMHNTSRFTQALMLVFGHNASNAILRPVHSLSLHVLPAIPQLKRKINMKVLLDTITIHPPASPAIQMEKQKVLLIIMQLHSR